MSSLLVTGIGQMVTMEDNASRPVRGRPAGSALGVVRDGWIMIDDGIIREVGSGAPPRSGFRGEPVLDAGGGAVVPGLVDPHTHALFGQWRAGEFEMRLQGAGYIDILKSGGGILSTVDKTRSRTGEELYQLGRERLDAFMSLGTTTVEVKSGYGLDLDTEMRMLNVIRDLDHNHCLDVVPTFMGAHAIPPEFSDDPDGYVDVLISSMLPRVASDNLARFVDVFCEDGAFTPDQAERILLAARDIGLPGRIHADEMEGGDGAILGVRAGVISADHLVHVSPEGIEALAGSETIATLLPGTSFFLRLASHAPGRELWDAGAAVALATDFNPGSCPIQDLKLVMTLSCLNLGLFPAEALVAATINSAHALGMGSTVGAIQPGYAGDLLVLFPGDWRHLVYRPAADVVRVVVKRGQVVSGDGSGSTSEAECRP